MISEYYNLRLQSICCKEGKKEIKDYFKNKYEIEVMNESLDSLGQKGMVGKLWNLNNGHRKGMLTGIKNQDIDFNNKAVIEGSITVNKTL